ncbi:S41 family peptidase, partial [uncultured Parasutterella sp.]
MFRGLLLVSGGMVAGALISASLAGPAKQGASILPLDEIRQFTDVYGAVKQFYVEPVEDKKLMKEAISGMLSGLDPHSAFLDEEAYKDLQEGTAGEFGGLGIEVSADPSGVKVISPIDDTPAARAHIRAGDIIFKIDGKLIKDQSLNDSVKMMRGKPDTNIELSILRKGSAGPINIKLTRAIIKVQSVKSKPLPDGMGYVRISQFQERTSSDLANALESLNKSGNLKNGLVLDLRNDPGGLLNAAIGVSAAFLPKGSLVVSTKGQIEDAKKEYITSPKDYQVVREDAAVEKLPEVTK